MKNKKSNTVHGFTLMEIMIVVAIIGILASIAVPSYQNHVLITHRKAAIADIMALQQELERGYVVSNGQYNEILVNGASIGDCSVTSELTSGSPPRYRFSVDIPPANNSQSYTITAIACSIQEDESCGNLRVNSDDIRTVDTNRNGNWLIDSSCF